jgi:hypothetical protein
LPPVENPVETAGVAFNAVAWTYVHLRGRHGWEAERARSRVVSVVLHGVAGPEPPAAPPRRKERR